MTIRSFALCIATKLNTSHGHFGSDSELIHSMTPRLVSPKALSPRPLPRTSVSATGRPCAAGAAATGGYELRGSHVPMGLAFVAEAGKDVTPAYGEVVVVEVPGGSVDFHDAAGKWVGSVARHDVGK